MTEVIDKTKKSLTKAYIASIREGGGCTPVEADCILNSASRRVIMAFIDHFGTAWVGNVNRYSEDKDKPYLRQVNRESENGIVVYNFGADFVVPEYDAELERRVIHYNTAGQTNAIKNIEAIYDRVEELSGAMVHWS